MAHRNTCKRDAIAALLVLPELNIDDLEQDYLSLLGATSPQVNDGWLEVFQKFGAIAGQFNTAAMEFLLGQGAPGNDLPGNWKWFWCVQGGVVISDTANMLDRDGNSYLIALGIPDRNGVIHVVTDVFLDRDGNPHTVI